MLKIPPIGGLGVFDHFDEVTNVATQFVAIENLSNSEAKQSS